VSSAAGRVGKAVEAAKSEAPGAVSAAVTKAASAGRRMLGECHQVDSGKHMQAFVKEQFH
jgi:hypothetical protein